MPKDNKVSVSEKRKGILTSVKDYISNYLNPSKVIFYRFHDDFAKIKPHLKFSDIGIDEEKCENALKPFNFNSDNKLIRIPALLVTALTLVHWRGKQILRYSQYLTITKQLPICVAICQKRRTSVLELKNRYSKKS